VKDCKADDCRWLECECEDDFEKLLQSFKYCWVKINRGGPEKVEGILQDVSCEFVTLIVKEEVILVAVSHIKSVTVPCRESEESESESESESNDSGRARAQRQSRRGR
ncbi:spore coat protein, partial [Bacillus sp. HC-TM]